MKPEREAGMREVFDPGKPFDSACRFEQLREPRPQTNREIWEMMADFGQAAYRAGAEAQRDREKQVERQLAEAREALRLAKTFVTGYSEGSLVVNEDRAEAFWEDLLSKAKAALRRIEGEKANKNPEKP